MKKMPIITLSALIACTVLCGCAEDSKEINLKLSEAIAAESSQNYDVAEKLYHEVVRETPHEALAHINLALLLHNHRKDYLGAIHHYMAYLELVPDSDKATLVRQHLETVKALYREDVAREDIAKYQEKLTRECDNLKKEVTAAKLESVDLRDELSKKKETIKDLELKITSLNRMIDELKSVPVSKIEDDTDLDAVKQLADEIVAQPQPETTEEPTSTDDNLSIDDIRALADTMINEEDGGQAEINEATRLATEGVKDEDALLATPTPGEYYTVRPSDTYISIARTAYGSAAKWKVIRDENRGPTNPDDRLRAGEVIFIPAL